MPMWIIAQTHARLEQPLVFTWLGIPSSALTIIIYYAILIGVFVGLVSLIAMFSIWWSAKSPATCRAAWVPTAWGRSGFYSPSPTG
jgi:hypothetical protein